MTRMQSFESNTEASSQTFLSIPPYCTREMLRKSGDVLGTVNGVSYQEYFDDSSHTILTPSPWKPATYDLQKEEVCYKVSSLSSLHEESGVTTPEEKYSEECEEREAGEKDKNAMDVIERPDVATSRENVAVPERPVIGSQGDVAFSADLKDTGIEKGSEISHICSSALENNLARERAALSDSDHSVVSSTKVEVGSQPDLTVAGTSLNDLASLIGSSLVTKPLMEAQSEGQCKKKKKAAKNLRRVSKSVPHVAPEDMQHLNDFSRAVTQEAIYAEMSSGDDAFNGDHDQYQDEDDSSYSSESDDDISQTISQDTDELGFESNSSLPAPSAPPASAATSPDESTTPASRREDYRPSNSSSTLQDDTESRASVEQSSANLELLTESYIDQLGAGSSEGLLSQILDHPEISFSSESAEQNTDSQSSKSPTPRNTYVKNRSLCSRAASLSSNSTSTVNSRQEERECKTRRLEKLVEKLCQDFVAQNPSVKQNPATLVSYFENAGAVIRSFPVVDLRSSLKSVSKDIAAEETAANRSQASSESSKVASLDSIRAFLK